jgi:hypothetical protein
MDSFGTCTGSNLANGDGTCVSTGGNTTGSDGAVQGTQWQRAIAALTPVLAGIFIPSITNTIVTDLSKHLESVQELGLKLSKWAELGRAGEAFAHEFLTDEDYTILAEHLFVLTSRGLRITDILATGGDAGNTIRGFEVKVNNSPYTETQKVKDSLIATQGGTILSRSKPGFTQGNKIKYETYVLHILNRP